MNMDTRKEKEKVFHDQLRLNSLDQRWSRDLEQKIKAYSMWSNMKYYSVERKSRAIVLDWFRKECKGKKILDYCCGNGEDGLYIAANGACEVIGIDISDVSVNNCNERTQHLGICNLSFKVSDAEAMDFDKESFDVVTEYGALHHLDLEKAYAEIARVLKTRGKAICVEALGHNKLIQLYRNRTPDLRTEWETQHILKKKDIVFAKKYFDVVDILGFFHLSTLGAVPFRNIHGFNVILGILERVDSLLLRLPVVQWQAWQVVFVLSHPKK